MTDLLQYTHFHLVGIKGVAMTALASCLVDAGKVVTGSDVAEEFVTQGILNKLGVSIQAGFGQALPGETECVIYTAAHQGQFNAQVKLARQEGLPTFSHAEALASLFNLKKGVAVCGVGGKSTTSAMISWVLEQIALAQKTVGPSYSVGVGKILGLPLTGQWRSESNWFVAEADEYVIDSTAPGRGEAITPRFSFMKPWLTVCTNLRFDHPDVYRDFNHTQEVFAKFFSQVKQGGKLVINGDDQPLVKLTQQVLGSRSDIQAVIFGQGHQAHLQWSAFQAQPGQSTAQIRLKNETYQLSLKLPGQYNIANAVAALAALIAMDVPVDQAITHLATFQSTKRRAELIGQKMGVMYFDDYAHHPHEIQSVIKAYREWYPTQRLVVAFQSHTFSRTKALFTEFTDAFTDADEVAMIDIFPSAREPFDASITSDMLCEAITEKHQLKAQNHKTLDQLAAYLKETLHEGDVCLTVGAGDIYHVHELI